MKYNFLWCDYEKLWEIPDFADEVEMRRYSDWDNVKIHLSIWIDIRI